MGAAVVKMHNMCPVVTTEFSPEMTGAEKPSLENWMLVVALIWTLVVAVLGWYAGRASEKKRFHDMLLPALQESYEGFENNGFDLMHPNAPPQMKNMQTQSQTTYTSVRGSFAPRFHLLSDAAQGSWHGEPG